MRSAAHGFHSGVIPVIAAIVLAGSLVRAGLAAKPPQKRPPAEPTARKGRAILSLDGPWSFAKDQHKSGETSGWTVSVPTQAAQTTVPSMWGMVDAPNYSGTAWYWRLIDAPAGWKGQTIRLVFHAVADRCTVWLNGTRLGQNSDGATPFEFNVTKSLKLGAQNLVAVEVEGDSARGAGIWQSVELISHDEAYIQDVFVTGSYFGRIDANTYLLNTSANSGDATLDGVVDDGPRAGHELARSNQNLVVTPNLNLTNFFLSVRSQDLHLWSIDKPTLYALKLIFRQEKDVLDNLDIPFGFRTLGLAAGQITINGAPLAPSAFTLPPSLTMITAAPANLAKIRAALEERKSAGTNIVWMVAPNPDILTLCDSMGLLVIEAPQKQLDDAARDTEMKELVRRDRCHPCVVGWSAGDCSADTVRELRRLDASRFILAGSGQGVQLYAPGKETPEPGKTPAGLLPDTGSGSREVWAAI